MKFGCDSIFIPFDVVRLFAGILISGFDLNERTKKQIPAPYNNPFRIYINKEAVNYKSIFFSYIGPLYIIIQNYLVFKPLSCLLLSQFGVIIFSVFFLFFFKFLFMLLFTPCRMLVPELCILIRKY